MSSEDKICTLGPQAEDTGWTRILSGALGPGLVFLKLRSGNSGNERVSQDRREAAHQWGCRRGRGGSLRRQLGGVSERVSTRVHTSHPVLRASKQ